VGLSEGFGARIPNLEGPILRPFTYLKKGLVSCYLSGDFLPYALLFFFFGGEFSQLGDKKKGLTNATKGFLRFEKKKFAIS